MVMRSRPESHVSHTSGLVRPGPPIAEHARYATKPGNCGLCQEAIHRGQRIAALLGLHAFAAVPAATAFERRTERHGVRLRGRDPAGETSESASNWRAKKLHKLGRTTGFRVADI